MWVNLGETGGKLTFVVWWSNIGKILKADFSAKGIAADFLEPIRLGPASSCPDGEESTRRGPQHPVQSCGHPADRVG